MSDKRKFLGYYNYTVVLTYLGMLMGFIGITMVMKESFWNAIVCMMIAGICDMFDGTVAATKKRDVREKRFGIQIDSLSDLICFGVFPGLFVYQICGNTTVSLAVACLYVLNALIRLAYFNVMEEERQQVETGARAYYLGLPVTTIALILPAFYLICNMVGDTSMQVLVGVLAVVAVMFISPIHIKKPHLVGKLGVCVVGIVELVCIVMGVLGAV